MLPCQQIFLYIIFVSGSVDMLHFLAADGRDTSPKTRAAMVYSHQDIGSPLRLQFFIKPHLAIRQYVCARYGIEQIW